MEIMKTKTMTVLLSAVALASLPSSAVEVDNVPDLINKLKELNGTAGAVIGLKEGDYHLPDEAMDTDESYYGQSTLLINKVKLVGLGAKPEDVKLIGAGNLRVIRSSGSATWIENLMITNGNATVKYKTCDGSVRGGGVIGSGTVTNCIIVGCSADFGGGLSEDIYARASTIRGNSAKSGGGGVNKCYSYGCTICDNESSSHGGGIYAPKALNDCLIASNSVGSTSYGGGAYSVKAATNCIFVGNSAGYGGGAGNHSSVGPGGYALVNCALSNNWSTGSSSGGGGAYRYTLRDCKVVGNWTEKAPGGGAAFCHLYNCAVMFNLAKGGSSGGAHLGDASDNLIVSNCFIYANMCSNSLANAKGGGVSGKGGTVIDSDIVGNCAWATTGANRTGSGGGAAEVKLVGCRVHDNYADSYGGGVYECAARDCSIYNNAAADAAGGPNAYNASLNGCNIADASVAYGSAVNSVFRDVREGTAVVLTNNPHKADFSCTQAKGVWSAYPNATNCLFVGNSFEQNLFTSGGSQISALVNCTIVSNVCRYTFAYFKNVASPLRVVNCVFFGNLTPQNQSRDIYPNGNTTDSSSIRFSNVIYGVAREDMNFDDWTDPADRGTIWQFGANGIATTPKFSGLPGAPLEPKTSSPLVGRGKVMDWMALAYDIRGSADGGKYQRLRDGKCDLGAYQCWLDRSGLMLLVR